MVSKDPELEYCMYSRDKEIGRYIFEELLAMEYINYGDSSLSMLKSRKSIKKRQIKLN